MNIKKFDLLLKGKSTINTLVIGGLPMLVAGIKSVIELHFPGSQIESLDSFEKTCEVLNSDKEFDLVLLHKTPNFEDVRKKGVDVLPLLKEKREKHFLIFLFSTEEATGSFLLKKGEIDANIGVSELHLFLKEAKNA